MTEKTKKWSEATVKHLMDLVGSQRPVSPETVENAAHELGEGFTARSVASKLRQLEVEVASMAKKKLAHLLKMKAQSLQSSLSAIAVITPISKLLNTL